MTDNTTVDEIIQIIDKLKQDHQIQILEHLKKITKKEIWYLYYKDNFGSYDGSITEYDSYQSCLNEFNSLVEQWTECASDFGTYNCTICQNLFCPDCTIILKHMDDCEIDSDCIVCKKYNKDCDECYEIHCDDCKKAIQQINEGDHSCCDNCEAQFDIQMSDNASDLLY